MKHLQRVEWKKEKWPIYPYDKFYISHCLEFSIVSYAILYYIFRGLVWPHTTHISLHILHSNEALHLVTNHAIENSIAIHTHIYKFVFIRGSMYWDWIIQPRGSLLAICAPYEVPRTVNHIVWYYLLCSQCLHVLVHLFHIPYCCLHFELVNYSLRKNVKSSESLAFTLYMYYGTAINAIFHYCAR